MGAPRTVLSPPAGPIPASTLPVSASLLASFIELLPAATQLAMDQIATRHAKKTIVCVSCGGESPIGGIVPHAGSCIVGEVFRLLHIIGQQPKPTHVKAIDELQQEEHCPPSPSPTAVAAADRVLRRHGFDASETFYEPWVIPRAKADAPMESDLEAGSVLNGLGNIVVDMYGSTIPDEDELRYARRIKACVNHCAGIPTSVLEAEEGGMR